jgi:hypothetical protein
MQPSINYKNCESLLKNNEESNKEIENLINISNPNKFKTKLQALKQQYPAVLEDFKNYYVFYNKNPESPEYQQMYANIQSNLSKVSADLHDILVNIEYLANQLNDKVLCLNAAIVQEKRKNRMLKRRLGIVEEKSNAADELIYDYKNIYDEGYLRNWALIISIIVAFIAVKNMYTINGDVTTNIRNLKQNVSNLGQNVSNMGQNVYGNMKNMGSNIYNKGMNMYK